MATTSAKRLMTAEESLRADLGEGVRELVRGEVPVAPDLVVEVVSPSNRPGELKEKVAEDPEAGVGLVWLVDPKHRSIALYRTSPVLLREGDEIRDLPGTPGFRCPVSDVFA